MKNMIKTICEKILASARRNRRASGPFAGRCDANAPATLLLATADVRSNRALGGHRGGDSRPVRRACTLRTPRLAQTARRFNPVHPLSTHSTRWGLRYAPLLPSRGQENKKCGGVKNKGS